MFHKKSQSWCGTPLLFLALSIVLATSATIVQAKEGVSSKKDSASQLTQNSATQVLNAPAAVPGLPPEPEINHQRSRIFHIGPIHMRTLRQVDPLRPFKLEADYNESISLDSALNYAMRNSLPIKIAHQSSNFQHWQLAGDISTSLPIPSTGMSYGQVFSNVISAQTHALSANYQPTINVPLFQGGSQVFGMLEQYYRYKGWHASFYASMNDALFDVFQKYESLVLHRTLLQIRAKAVEVSESELVMNNSLFAAGKIPQFALMQSRTQLDAEKQALIDEEFAFRLAALSLSYALNAPLAVNFVPVEESIAERALVDEEVPISTFLDIALKFRPELRQNENFRVASRRNIALAAAPLYPTFAVTGQYTYTETNTAQAASAAGNPNVGSPAGAGIFPGIFDTVQGNYTLAWNLTNLGLPTIANIKGVSILSRQAEIQANQQLMSTLQDVRTDYVNACAARSKLDDAEYCVLSSRDGLKFAEQRLLDGRGNNSELISAEVNYFTMLVNQVHTIYSSNIAQAKLLHDTGAVSIDSLCHGFKLTDKINSH